MIINTNKISDKLLEAYGYLITKNLRPSEEDKWDAFPCIEEHTIEYDKIFEDGKCIVEFGDVGPGFEIERPEIAKSLKNLPEYCGTFDISGLKIDVIDHLPNADNYILERCGFKKLAVKFPNNHPYKVYIQDSEIESLENFPKLVSNLILSDCRELENLKGIPWVGEQLYISHCGKLKDISDIDGSFHSIELYNLPITELPKLPYDVSSIELVQCKDLVDTSSLMELNDHTTVVIRKCPSIDYHTLCRNPVNIEIDDPNKHFESYKEVWMEIGEDKALKMTKEEFERAVYDYWFEKDNFRWETLPFKTKEIITRKMNYLKSMESSDKFNL
jgi:hypothetical protein